MANIKSAKKRAVQNIKKNAINNARKSAFKTAVKKVVTALEEGKVQAEVQVLFNEAQGQLARAKGKGTIHANTAARKIGRLAKRINKVFVPKEA